MKNIYYLLLVTVLFGLSLALSSCCADNTCAEDDIYGKTIIRQTDTLYNVVPKVVRGPFSIQIGAFANRGNAENLLLEASNMFTEQVKIIQTQDGLYRVIAGDYKTIDDAREFLNTAKQRGYGDSFIRDQYGPVNK
jgi:cell division protein FtsN